MLSALLITASLAAATPDHDLIGLVRLDTQRNELLGPVGPPDPFDAGQQADRAVEKPSPRARRMPKGPEMPIHLQMLWPKEVEPIEGLSLFTPTKFSQKLTVANGRSSNTWHSITTDDVNGGMMTTNPNRTFPYAVPGGLHNSTGWHSLRAARIPGSVTLWTEGVSVPGSQTPLPKTRWAFPSGTVFVDMLYKDGKCFELRTGTKGDDGKWKHEPLYRDLDAAPKNFHGAGMACATCHKDAGQSQNYGVTIRGDDHCFSWTPFVDGTRELRPDVGFVRGQTDLKGARLAEVVQVAQTFAPVMMAQPIMRAAPMMVMSRGKAACTT